MRTASCLLLLSILAAPLGAQPRAAGLPSGVTTREVTFFSEAVECYGKLFLPSGFSAASQAAAVVLAPGLGQTAASVEQAAAHLAAAGMVALAIDYRGWGRSGAFIYLAEPIRWDDRLRFSQHTARVRLRRKRLVPAAQITDIRNAITYLQGEPGVDRARIGVWGTGLGGGHAISVAAMDARPKAVVAQAPTLPGMGSTRTAFAPSQSEQADMIKLARSGAPAVVNAAAATSQDPEMRLAMAQYKPFLMLDVVPQTTAVLFVVAEQDASGTNETAAAASKLLKGATDVARIPGDGRALTGSAAAEAAAAAAQWFAKHL